MPRLRGWLVATLACSCYVAVTGLYGVVINSAIVWLEARSSPAQRRTTVFARSAGGGGFTAIGVPTPPVGERVQAEADQAKGSEVKRTQYEQIHL